VLISAGFAYPLVMSLWFRADPLTIANESIAYRFLFSERLINGEGASVWVLAGFLTTAIQTNLLQLINFLAPYPVDDLAHRVHLYAYGFTGLITLGGAAVMVAAACNRRFSPLDLVLLALPALGPLFATKISGFYYYTLPDYYHLNVLLAVMSVWIFQSLWHGRAQLQRINRTIFLAGLFVGALCGNKITMLIVGAPLLGLLWLKEPISPAKLCTRAMLAAAGLTVGFFFVLAWFYLFDLGAVREMLPAWLAVIQNPGGESDFWSSNFRSHLTGYSYGYIIAFYLLALATAIGCAWHARETRTARLATLVLMGLGGAAWSYFIYKRPAGTTFFEAAVALFTFSAIALTTCSRHRLGSRAIVIFALFWTIYSAATFAGQRNLATLAASRPWADQMWRLHHELLAFAKGREILVIHPQNNYGYGGVAEFLLKGTADVPSWNVSSHGRPILDRYAPHMTFRHEYSGIHPNAPFPDNAVVFWVDRPEFPPMIEQYRLLKEAYLQPGIPKKEWSMEIQGGHAIIKAHAIQLPESRLPQKQRVLAAPLEGFTGYRLKPDTIQLTWRADGIATIALQFKSGDGDWFALGRAKFFDERLSGGRYFTRYFLHHSRPKGIRRRSSRLGGNSYSSGGPLISFHVLDHYHDSCAQRREAHQWHLGNRVEGCRGPERIADANSGDRRR